MIGLRMIEWLREQLADDERRALVEWNPDGPAPAPPMPLTDTAGTAAYVLDVTRAHRTIVDAYAESLGDPARLTNQAAQLQHHMLMRVTHTIAETYQRRPGYREALA